MASTVGTALSARRNGRPRGAAALTATALALFGLVTLLDGCASAGRPLRVADADQERPPAAAAGGVQLASAAGSFLAGAHAEHSRDFATAARFFSDALALDQDNRRLRRTTLVAMVASGEIDKAAALARRMTGKETAPMAALSLVAEDARKGDFAAAEKRLKDLPRRGLNAFAAPLLYAWALAARGETDAALKALDPLAEIAGVSALRELHIALIDEYAGRIAAAETAYKAAAADHLSLRVARGYGALLERQGRTADAKAIYEKFLADQPQSDAFDFALQRVEGHRAGKPKPLVSNPREGMAEVLFNLAGTLAQSRSTEQALLYGRLALYLRPHFPIARILVAGVLESLDRTGEALAMYEKVDPKDPLSWTARLHHAAALESLDRTDEAIRELRAMAKERPDQADALVRLGDVLRAEKRYDDAAKAYTEALQRVGTPSQRHWPVFYARGIAYERLNEWPKAEKDFLEALKLSPDEPYVLNYLGYSWVDKGIHLKRARAMIERAVQLRPDDGYIVDSLGWVLFRLGDYRKATEQLERAVVLRPDDPTINDHLGDAYWRVGRRDEARFQWRRALTLDPEKEDIPRIERKIRDGLNTMRHAREDGN